MNLKCLFRKLKKVLTFCIIITLTNTTVIAQQSSRFTDKGSSILTSSFSFTSQKGALYRAERSRISSLDFNLNYLYFTNDYFGIGINSGVKRTQNLDNKITMLSFGPTYEIYSGGNITKFFFSLNPSYLHEQISSEDESDSGFRLNIGVGFLIQKNHVGLNIKGGLKYDNLGAGDIGTIRYFSIGASGLFYPDEEK